MKKTILFLTICLGIFTSCMKEDPIDPNSILVDSQIKPNELDNYIQRQFTKPFNIAIIYKYVDKESDLNYNLSPAGYEFVVRMTRLIEYYCIKPYMDITGDGNFIKNNFPKILNYVGSPAYNNNGTMVIGTAEGGKKITMYNLNQMDLYPNNIQYLNDMYFHTIHHEFAHILNQTKPYLVTFDQISATSYVSGSWNDEFGSPEEALNQGFISPYAGSEAREDFVELIAFYVTLTPEQWQARIGAASTQGRAIILQKLDIVRDYMLSEWEIDIDVLRDNINERQANHTSFDQNDIK